jgi:replicative DNA helicase
LLMYAYLYLKLNPSLDFHSVIAGNISFKNIKNKLIKISKKINSRTSKTLLIDDLVLESFEKQIKSVLQKIVNEDFTQTDDVKSCEWCDYKSICNR